MTNTTRWTSTLLLAWGLAAPNAGGAQQQRTPEPYRIAAIQAKLYYADDASFSENVIDDADFQLWNVVIGEGSARAPSKNVLVLVEVTGPRLRNAGQRSVELAVFERGPQPRLKLRQASRIGLIEGSGRTFVAFWLYDTGCVPLRLRAAIMGEPGAARVEKLLPFRCGE